MVHTILGIKASIESDILYLSKSYFLQNIKLHRFVLKIVLPQKNLILNSEHQLAFTDSTIERKA